MTFPVVERGEVHIAVFVSSIDVASSACGTWSRIGGFADAGRFLRIASQALTGQSGIGSARRVGDTIVELMVGASDTSYAYVQTEGPMALNLYHGCVALSPTGPSACRLTYTIIYDETRMNADERVAQRLRISERFQEAIEAMKQAAEA